MTGQSELAVRGLQAMLQPHASQVSVVTRRPDDSGPWADLTLYEPAGRGEQPEASPRRLGARMVAFGWDCSPEAVSTEISRGAAGFVSKWVPARRLVRDLQAIAAGRAVVDTWTGPARGREDRGSTWPLTQRETEMLTLIASGWSNNEIAEESHLSINSVKSYIRTAYAKIGVSSRSQAVLWAIQHGLLMSAEDGHDAAFHREVRA